MDWSLRLATPADAEQLAASVSDGFASYRSFAPADWQPPSADMELALLDEALARDDVWCLRGRGRRAAGRPRRHPRRRDRALRLRRAGLAHFWQLFVKPPWHGSGLALELHREAVREAGERGFRAMRLYAAAGQARARRFYEREGWVAAGPPFDLPGFGLPVVEYRLPISISV